MRDSPLHPQKKVRIEHISDDVRSLHQASVEQQKVLLSGNAIADFLKGDRFDVSRNSDKTYFEHTVPVGNTDSRYIEDRTLLKTNGKVDLDRVTDACIRYVKQSEYLNGPDMNTASGFIYVASILPGGSLSWDNALNTIRAEKSTDEFILRQIFYPNDLQDFVPFTRCAKRVTVGTKHYWDWSEWRPMSERMLRILVTQSTVGLVNYNSQTGINPLRSNIIYELHCSATSMILPNADNIPAGYAIMFEQYSNHQATYSSVDTSTVGGVAPTPSPIVRYFVKQYYTGSSWVTIKRSTSVPSSALTRYTPAGTNQGWLTSFASDTLYYIESAPEAWSSIVKYTEKVATDNGGTEDQEYSTYMTASLDTIRTSATSVNDGEWFENTEQAVQYRFEVVDRESEVEYTEGNQTKTSTKSWLMDVDAEAVTRMSDFAELLDAHTDPMLTDIVQYSLRQFRASGSKAGNVSAGNADYAAFVPKVDEPLVVSRPASMSGFVHFKLTIPNINNLSSLTSSFKIRIFVFNEYSSDFQSGYYYAYQVATGTPNMYRRYYVLNNGKYELAGASGFLNSFETGKTYYTRTVALNAGISPAKFKYDLNGTGATEYSAEFLANDSTTFGRSGVYFGTDKNTSLEGYIKAARNDTIMVIINSDKHYAENGGDITIVSPLVEFYPDPHDTYVKVLNVNNQSITMTELNKIVKAETSEDMVAGSKALVRAFETIVNTLQGKGLMYGNLPLLSGSSIDSQVAPGIYTVNGATMTGQFGVTDNKPNTKTSVTSGNSTLIVLDSVAYGSDKLLDSAHGGVDVDLSNSTVRRTTQFLIGNATPNGTLSNDTCPRFWMRFGTGSGDWSRWISFQPSQMVFNYQNSDVSVDDSVKCLAYGSPIIEVNGNGSSTRTVSLPDPTNYAGYKMQIEAINCPIKIVYTKSGTTYEYTNAAIKTSPSRMLYPIECDGVNWYVITVS